VLVMRALAPPELTDEVVATLAALKGVSNVIVGGVTCDNGEQAISADVTPGSADELFKRLETLGIDSDSVTLVRHTTVGAVARHRAGSWFAHGQNALVWAEAVDTARENAMFTGRYFLFMVAAGVIATYGIILRNPILVVGAMAVSPDLMLLTAFCIGLVGRRLRLAMRGAVILLVGLTIAGTTAWALTRVMLRFGAYDGVLSSGYALEGIVTSVNSDTVMVALTAGIVGMLAFQSRASTAVGVAISVTTIPAVAFFGVAVGIGDYGRGKEALLVLLVNVMMLFVGGVLTLLLQRTIGRRYT
jgi:uncharacterized hydrophobic protein (TIGR00271 family)